MVKQYKNIQFPDCIELPENINDDDIIDFIKSHGLLSDFTGKRIEADEIFYSIHKFNFRSRNKKNMPLLTQMTSVQLKKEEIPPHIINIDWNKPQYKLEIEDNEMRSHITGKKINIGDCFYTIYKSKCNSERYDGDLIEAIVIAIGELTPEIEKKINAVKIIK